LSSIFLAYNEFEDTDSITITLNVNGSDVATGLFLKGSDCSQNTSPGIAWMKFDLSSANVTGIAGSNSFTITATDQTGSGFAFAPLYARDEDYYAGGALSGSGIGALPPGADLGFVIDRIPEPGTGGLLLVCLAGLAVNRRRR